MGERKGVNKYYPPDYDPKRGGLNKFLGTHALRERARKLHLGILIIRFEMPYNIWCDGCENHIGMGVRYNAEKKKVGMYYSTPIYQFRMKCHLCDNHFEIKTDPAEKRWDPTQNEQVAPEEREVTKKLAADAMFRLEHGVDDKKKSVESECSIEKLYKFNETRWRDDYTSNKILRGQMRTKRKEAQLQSEKDRALNLPDVSLLPSNENDSKLAKLLQFTQSKSSEILKEDKRTMIDSQSVFENIKNRKPSSTSKKNFAKQSLKDIVKASHSELSDFSSEFKSKNFGIIQKDKVKTSESYRSTNLDTQTSHTPQKETQSSTTLLVQYDSSSSSSD